MRFGRMEVLLTGLVVGGLPIFLQAADVNLQNAINNTPAGGTLNLNPADRYIGNASFSRNIVVEGNGATIDLASAPDYRALRVNGGVNATIRNVTIKNANIGLILLAGSTSTISGSKISDCDIAVVLDSGTTTLTNTQLLNCSQNGIKVGAAGLGFATLNGTTISGCNIGASLISGSITAQNSTWQNQSTGIAGTGDVALTTCTFNNLSDFGLHMFAADGSSDFPEITVSGSTFIGGNYGLQLVRSRASVTNSEFRNLNQAIALLDNRVAKSADTDPKVLPEQVAISGSTFSNISLFGIVVRAGKIAITDCGFTAAQIPIELEQAANATITGCNINSATITLPIPGVGIAVREGSQATIRNTTVTRHQNSIDIQDGSSATVEDCLLDNPIFSGLILARNSHMTVRRVIFRRNGQDAIAENSRAAGQGLTGPSLAPCTALVEDCYFDEAGTEPVNPDYNIDVQVGGGLIFEGGGPFVVRNCIIERCHGNGIGIGYDAEVEATNNVIWRNELAAISIGTEASLTARDNMLFGSLGDQAGMNITVSDLPIKVLSERNWYLSNGFGLLHSNPGHEQTYRDDVFFGNRGQGMSLAHRGPLVNGQQGTVFSERTVFAENGGAEGFQIYVRSLGQSTFKDGVISSTSNRDGLFTQRGPCNNVVGPPSIATGNYWGHPSGPVNGCEAAVPAGRMGYQNSVVTPFATAAKVEVFHWLDPHRNAAYISSVDSRPWMQMQLSVSAQDDTLLVATRNTSRNILAVAPPRTTDARAIVIQTSRVFRNLGGKATLSMTTSAPPNKPVRLERLDPTTGTTLYGIDGTINQGRAIFVVPTSELVNGCYFLTDTRPAPIDQLIDTQPATPDDDLNNDGVLDAAEVVVSPR